MSVERSGTYSLVNVSDLHVPYLNVKAFEYMLKFAEKNCAGIVINGDVFDAGNASRYEHYAVDRLLESYSQVVALLQECAKVFKDVFVTAGNHDLRYERMLRRNLVIAELADLFGGFDILERACNEANVKYFRNGVKVNDVIFFHPDTYLSTPLGTARKTVEHMLQYRDNFRAVSIGHTHQLAHGEHLGRLMFESGRMCMITPWEVASHNLNKKYTRTGFVVFNFENCNMTSYTFCEWGNEP